MTRQTTFQELIDEGLLEIGDGYRAQNNELGGTGPIFLRAGHVTDSHIDFTDVEHFHEELAEKVRSKMSKVDDTIVTTKGNSTGRTSFVTNRLPPFVYSPHLSYWRSREPRKLCGGFLRYWSRGREFIEQLSGMKASTDMAPYLSLTDQRRLTITLPPPNEQNAIAAVLGALDDKIELNRRMNATLEAIARALFQSWFVDFDPVRAKLDGRQPPGLDPATAALFPNEFEDSELGHIPKGWTAGKLGDVGTNSRRSVRPGAIAPNTLYIALEHMPRRSITLGDWDESADVASGKSAFKKGEILFGKLRPYFHKVGVAPFDGVCSTDILVLAPKSPEWFGYLLGHASSDELISFTDLASTGTKMPRTNWADISSFKVAIPSEAIAASFSQRTRPIVERIIANLFESRTLGSLRDTLLPKLLGGHIRIN